MKIKLSKTLAIALALCLTFAGFSAFAADVEIVTSYDYEQAADAQVSVTAKVNNIAEGSEVTYYVSAGDDIVYINQATADANGVTFPTFTAAWNKLTASKVVFGSDAGKSWSGFTFVPAGNYKTEGTATATADKATWGINAGPYDGMSGISFTATVTGNYSEYGIRVTQDGETVDLPALGCSEEGSYTVFIGADNASDLEGIKAEAYAK